MKTFATSQNRYFEDFSKVVSLLANKNWYNELFLWSPFEGLTNHKACQVYVNFVPLQHSKSLLFGWLISARKSLQNEKPPLRPFNRSDMTSFFSVDLVSVFIHYHLRGGAQEPILRDEQTSVQRDHPPRVLSIRWHWANTQSRKKKNTRADDYFLTLCQEYWGQRYISESSWSRTVSPLLKLRAMGLMLAACQYWDMGTTEKTGQIFVYGDRQSLYSRRIYFKGHLTAHRRVKYLQ